MKVRGRRECQSCGNRWSYYDTGSVACPACGSLRSVGVDEHTLHTTSPVSLNLSEHRNALDEAELGDVADGVVADLREYTRRRGFVHEGRLLGVDDEFLAANELRHALDVFGRARDPGDDERLYAVDLLRGADAGERPPVERVPESMREARGLGYADALDEYRSEVLTWLDEHPDPAGRRTLGTLGERLKRVQALHGDVPPSEAETLVRVARELHAYLTDDDESALTRAEDRLSRLD
jgi:hypothetical protein